MAGAGGYANDKKSMHTLQKDANSNPIPHDQPFQTTLADVVLNHYEEESSGFLRITVDSQFLTGEYFSVPFDGPPPSNSVDTFKLNWKTHRMAAEGNAGSPVPRRRGRR